MAPCTAASPQLQNNIIIGGGGGTVTTLADILDSLNIF